MENLKKMNFTELDASEMKIVHGGDAFDDVIKLVELLGNNYDAIAAILGMSVEEVRRLLGV